MNIDATMKTVLVVSLLACIMPATWFFWKLPPPVLTPPEKELMTFTSPPLSISRPRQQATFSGLDSPVRAAVKKPPPVAPESKSTATVQLQAGSPPASAWKQGRRISFDSRPAVSMIYCDGSIKTAIIDGHVLHEGSALGRHLVVKIERKRVLMRVAGKDIWLGID